VCNHARFDIDIEIIVDKTFSLFCNPTHPLLTHTIHPNLLSLLHFSKAAPTLRKKQALTAGAAGPGRGQGGSSAGVLRFYTDDSPGIKMGPTTVLLSSSIFIGLVVLLHVWGRLKSST